MVDRVSYGLGLELGLGLGMELVVLGLMGLLGLL